MSSQRQTATSSKTMTTSKRRSTTAAAAAATNVTGSAGGDATLPCDARTDSPSYLLQWLKEGVVVYTQFSTRVQGRPADGFEGRLDLGQNHALLIQQLSPSDAALYRCEMHVYGVNVDTPLGTPVRLHVHTVPHLTERPPSKIYKTTGQSITLTCAANGNPPPNIRWVRRGRVLENNADTSAEIHLSESSSAEGAGSSSSSLRIHRLRPHDNGEWACLAANRLGSDKHVTDVRFARPASISSPPGNKTALEGVSVDWTCGAQAEPSNVEYQWYKGDTAVRSAGGLGLRSNVQRGSLFISPVHRSDAGWYTCTATNGYGATATARAYLDVQYPAEVSASTPKIQYVPKGLSGRVQCSVSANPPAQNVFWSHTGTRLDQTAERYVREDNGATLVIKQVRPTDAGDYVCHAFNGIGGSSANGQYEIHVIVAEAPHFTREPPEEVEKRPGDQLRLSCAGDGDPKPEVFWRRRDLPSERLGTGDALGPSASLDVSPLTAVDHGVYECVVKNRVTELVRRTQVVVTDTIPQAPKNVRASTGAFDAKISWTPGYNGGYPQKFKVKFRTSPHGPYAATRWRELDAGASTGLTLTHLHPDTAYELVVTPVNAKGLGLESQKLQTRTRGADAVGNAWPTDTSGVTYVPEIQTAIGPKPNAPSELQVTDDHGDVLLFWKEPQAKDDAIVRYYSVQYKNVPYYTIVSLHSLGEPASKPRAVPSSQVASNAITTVGQTSHASPDAERVNDELNSDSFSILRTNIKGTRLRLPPGQTIGKYPALASGETYEFRVRAHDLASFSWPSNVVRYTLPRTVPEQFAITIAVAGGLAFLILFLLLAACLVKRSRHRRNSRHMRHKDSYMFAGSNGSAPRALKACNGNATAADWALDASAPYKSDASLFVDSAAGLWGSSHPNTRNGPPNVPAGGRPREPGVAPRGKNLAAAATGAGRRDESVPCDQRREVGGGRFLTKCLPIRIGDYWRQSGSSEDDGGFKSSIDCDVSLFVSSNNNHNNDNNQTRETCVIANGSAVGSNGSAVAAANNTATGPVEILARQPTKIESVRDILSGVSAANWRHTFDVDSPTCSPAPFTSCTPSSASFRRPGSHLLHLSRPGSSRTTNPPAHYNRDRLLGTIQTVRQLKSPTVESEGRLQLRSGLQSQEDNNFAPSTAATRQSPSRDAVIQYASALRARPSDAHHTSHCVNSRDGKSGSGGGDASSSSSSGVSSADPPHIGQPAMSSTPASEADRHRERLSELRQEYECQLAGKSTQFVGVLPTADVKRPVCARRLISPVTESEQL